MDALSEQDKYLYEGCVTGNEKIMGLFYKKFSPIVYAQLRRYLPVQADVEDVLQDTFIKIFLKISEYNHVGSFEGWIKRIAINTALNLIKKRRTETIDFDTIDEECLEPVSLNFSCDSNLLVNELYKIIELLPMQKRLIFNLYEIEGYSHKEISELLEISESASRAQLTKARQILAQIHAKLNKR